MICAVIGCVAWIFLRIQSYGTYEVTKSMTGEGTVGGTYLNFAGGFIRYTGNSVSFKNSELTDLWNYTCELSNPVADVCGETLALADLSGNKIYVFGNRGLIGSITARFPVRAVSVSGNGVVAVVMRNDTQTMFELYASDGTELVEAQTSLADSGYPLAIDLSEDGKRLLVSYIKVAADVKSTVVCYDFSDSGATDSEQKIMENEYEGSLIPTVAFLGNGSAVAVGTDGLRFFHGGNSMKETGRTGIEGEIKSLVCDGQNFGIVRENPGGEERYSFILYGPSGRVRHEWTFDDEYRDVILVGDQVILRYDSGCMVYRAGGRLLFDGDAGNTDGYLLPAGGFNKYCLVGPDRVDLVRLVLKQDGDETEGNL